MPNLGVTLDFAHVLFADEMPAYSAALVAKHSKLLGVHLNDGYAKRDDGLMVGAVHPIQTLELLYVLNRVGYDGAIYFDTFPDTTGLDPIGECEANIATVGALRRAVVPNSRETRRSNRRSKDRTRSRARESCGRRSTDREDPGSRRDGGKQKWKGNAQ